ncbi:19704_t:CDS:2, partial [Funneliformis geosporum]
DNSSGSDDNINDIPAGNGDGNSEYINYEFLNEKEWGNDDGSRWDDPEDIEAKIKLNQRLKEFSKMPKSTYYDKYDPNGSLTKAAAEDSSSDSENKIFNLYTYQIAEKIKDLKKQLEKQHNQLTVVEYNHKKAIFEYLTLLNSNNRRKR